MRAREVEELLVRSKFTPRPSQKGARSLRPEIPAPKGGISGLPPETSRIKMPHTKTGHE